MHAVHSRTCAYRPDDRTDGPAPCLQGRTSATHQMEHEAAAQIQLEFQARGRARGEHPQVDKGLLRYWRLCLRRSARRGGECLPALKARNADDSRAQNAATLSPLMPGGRARSATPPHYAAATCSCVRLPWVSPPVLNWEASVYGGKGEGKNAAELPLASRKQETPAFSGVSAR